MVDRSTRDVRIVMLIGPEDQRDSPRMLIERNQSTDRDGRPLPFACAKACGAARPLWPLSTTCGECVYTRSHSLAHEKSGPGFQTESIGVVRERIIAGGEPSLFVPHHVS